MLNLKSKAPSTKDNVEYDFNLCRHIGLSEEWGPIYNKHFGRSISDLAKVKVERNSDGSGDYASGIPGIISLSTFLHFNHLLNDFHNSVYIYPS